MPCIYDTVVMSTQFGRYRFSAERSHLFSRIAVTSSRKYSKHVFSFGYESMVIATKKLNEVLWHLTRSRRRIDSYMLTYSALPSVKAFSPTHDTLQGASMQLYPRCRGPLRKPPVRSDASLLLYYSPARRSRKGTMLLDFTYEGEHQIWC